MAYAPHTNTQVHDQLRRGLVEDSRLRLPLLFGIFTAIETGASFEYSERRHPDDNFAPEMPHTIYVGNPAQTRLAKVLATVAYVVVDEGEDGPVIEKWAIRRHRKYDTSWVRV